MDPGCAWWEKKMAKIEEYTSMAPINITLKNQPTVNLQIIRFSLLHCFKRTKDSSGNNREEMKIQDI